MTIMSDNGVRLFVGNLDYRLMRKHVEQLFEPEDRVCDLFLPLDRTDQQDRINRGFAFVTVATQECADAVKERLSDSKDPFYGRQLRITDAEPRTPQNQNGQ